MAKELTYKGKSWNELKNISIADFIKIVPSRTRRSLRKGFTEQQKRLLLKIKKLKDGDFRKPVRTHCRDMIIVPELVGHLIQVHNGREFVSVQVTQEMLGKYLGEFVVNRKKVEHSAPGIGATKSSAAMSVK